MAGSVVWYELIWLFCLRSPVQYFPSAFTGALMQDMWDIIRILVLTECTQVFCFVIVGVIFSVQAASFCSQDTIYVIRPKRSKKLQDLVRLCHKCAYFNICVSVCHDVFGVIFVFVLLLMDLCWINWLWSWLCCSCWWWYWWCLEKCCGLLFIRNILYVDFWPETNVWWLRSRPDCSSHMG